MELIYFLDYYANNSVSSDPNHYTFTCSDCMCEQRCNSKPIRLRFNKQLSKFLMDTKDYTGEARNCPVSAKQAITKYILAEHYDLIKKIQKVIAGYRNVCYDLIPSSKVNSEHEWLNYFMEVVFQEVQRETILTRVKDSDSMMKDLSANDRRIKLETEFERGEVIIDSSFRSENYGLIILLDDVTTTGNSLEFYGDKIDELFRIEVLEIAIFKTKN